MFEQSVFDQQFACHSTGLPIFGWDSPMGRGFDENVSGNQGFCPTRMGDLVRKEMPSFSLDRPQRGRPPAILTWIFSSSWRAARAFTKERNTSGRIFPDGEEMSTSSSTLRMNGRRD